MTEVGTPRLDPVRWAARCTAALAVFQLVIAILVYANRSAMAGTFTASGFLPTPAAAQGAVLGTLVVHLLLAALCAVLAWRLPRRRRVARVLGTILLAAVAIGGVAAMSLPSQTYLSPLGSALAVAAVVLIWLRRRD